MPQRRETSSLKITFECDDPEIFAQVAQIVTMVDAKMREIELQFEQTQRALAQGQVTLMLPQLKKEKVE